MGSALPLSVKVGMVVGLIGLLIGLYSFFSVDPGSEMSDRLDGLFFLLVIVFWGCWFWTILPHINERNNDADGADLEKKKADLEVRNFKKYKRKKHKQ